MERPHALIELQKQISKRKNQRMIGKIPMVLVDEISRRDKGKLKGKTRTNKTVIIQANKDILGTIAPVKILDADSFTLFGKLEE